MFKKRFEELNNKQAPPSHNLEMIIDWGIDCIFQNIHLKTHHPQQMKSKST